MSIRWIVFLILCALGGHAPDDKRGGDKKKAYGGPNYGLDAAEVQRLLASRTVDVPYVEQEGTKCGLYALKMVLAFHHKADAKKRNPRVQKGEGGDTTVEPMFDYAKRAGYLWNDKGETTHGHLRKIASAYGYEAKADEDPAGPDVDDLKRELAKGRPVLCSVRAVTDGRPSTGEDFVYGGHWVVVEGFAMANDGKEYVIVKHGWSGGSIIWSVDEFERSWSKNWSATVYVW